VKGIEKMQMISVKSNEIIAIGYNEEEKAIYVQDKLHQTCVFENKSKEDFDQFKNSKQHDYFYLCVLKKLNHKIIAFNP
jgi:hypothetical protein